MYLPKHLLIIAFLISYVCSGGARADSVVDQERKLSEIQKRIRRLTLSVDGLQLKKDSLVAQLADVEKQYGRVVVELKALHQEVSQKQKSLKINQQKIRKQRASIDKQHKELVGIVRSAYALGRKERLKLMLNQQSPALSSRVVVYYEYLNKARLVRIRELNLILNDLAALEQENLQGKQRLKQAFVEKKLEQEKLANTKKTRERLLAKLEKDTSARSKQLRQLLESEKTLKILLASLQKAVSDFPFQEGLNKPFNQLRGQLAWPVKGKLESKFGSKRANSRWDGVLINASEGTEVRAVSRGRIVYADWLKGYGLMIIIDHGKGFMTLYAFNQGLMKDVGDWVDAGEIIAAVGKSNGRNQSGLYFGIRKKGSPVDPEKWCRKTRNGLVS